MIQVGSEKAALFVERVDRQDCDRIDLVLERLPNIQRLILRSSATHLPIKSLLNGACLRSLFVEVLVHVLQ